MLIGCKSCGNKAVENYELKLCSSCNKARRQPPVKLPKRTPIKPVSQKKAKALAALAKTKVKKREEGTRWCEGCGVSGVPLSHSHILPVGQFPQFEADPSNITMECFGTPYSCHTITETGTLQQMEQMANWPKKLKYILSVQPEYLEKIKLRSLKKERL